MRDQLPSAADLVGKPDTLSSSTRCTGSSLVIAANWVPIRVAYVGLFPYEQGILPSIAAALSYLLRTSSDRSQATADTAMMIKRQKRGQVKELDHDRRDIRVRLHAYKMLVYLYAAGVFFNTMPHSHERDQD